MMNEEITLQINISPGDINYASTTVPELVSKHPLIKNKLLIVDCNRPQKTKLVNPDSKFPLELFNAKVNLLLKIVENFKVLNLFTEIIILNKENQDLYKKLSKKYLRNFYDCTHSAGATANMSYWAGFEFVKTRFILHYDGDMLLYQQENYDWATEGASILKNHKNIISVVPPLAPGYIHELNLGVDFSTDHWFSTRIFLMDREKLNAELPLVKKGIFLELIFRKYLKRAFPRDPEIILFRALGYQKYKRAFINTNKAWVLHPTEKPKEFIDNLASIVGRINSNDFPSEQSKKEDIILNKWI